MASPSSRGRTGRPWRRMQAKVIAECSVCYLCGTEIAPKGTYPPRHRLSPSVDHVVPIAVDDSNPLDPDNLRAAHLGCNSSKGARVGRDAPIMRRSRPW